MKLRNGELKASAVAALLAAGLLAGVAIHSVGVQKQAAPSAPAVQVNPMQVDGTAPPPPPIFNPPKAQATALEILQADGGAPPPPPILNPPPPKSLG